MGVEITRKGSFKKKKKMRGEGNNANKKSVSPLTSGEAADLIHVKPSWRMYTVPAMVTSLCKSNGYLPKMVIKGFSFSGEQD